MQAAATMQAGAAQINVELGRIDDNLERHLAYIAQGHMAGLDLLVFPELSLTGYRLGANVSVVAMLRDDMRLRRLAAAAGSMQVVVGFIEESSPGEYFNELAILQHGELLAVHRKINLPNYGGLEEGKYFCSGSQLTQIEVFDFWHAAYLICAD